jgi:hypothetical protein
MATNIFIEIEKYIRNKIAMNGGFFNREQIWNESIEWFVNNPVEFNSILNLIENEGSRFADDSTPSAAKSDRIDDDSTPSVAFGGEYADDSTPSVAFGGEYADDSTPSDALGSRIDDDYTPVTEDSKSLITNIFYGYKSADHSPHCVLNHDEYSGNILPEHMSFVADSQMGSDQVDSSPGGYSDFETDTPLQRTISFAPPRRGM